MLGVVLPSGITKSVVLFREFSSVDEVACDVLPNFSAD